MNEHEHTLPPDVPQPMLGRAFGRGWVPDHHEDREKLPGLGRLTGARARALPHNVHPFTEHFEPEDQGDTSSCVGFAFQQALNLRLAYVGTPAPRFSPLAIYAYARMKDRSHPEERLRDDGCRPVQAVRGMLQFGVPFGNDWPLTLDEVNGEPPFDIAEKASVYVPTGIYGIHSEGDARVQDLMQALASGYPVAFGTEVDQAFMSVRGKTIVGPAGERTLGGHMMCFIGYDIHDDGKVIFECVNQYSAAWGDHGRFYCNEDFIRDPRLGDLTIVTVGPRKFAAKHDPIEIEGVTA